MATHSLTANALAAVAGTLLTASVGAQTDWTTATLFTPRSGLAAAYDSARDVTVWFGGDDAGRLLAEVWEWQAGALVRRATAPGPGPSPRTAHALAFDPVRQQTVLFGGVDALGDRADTWLWDGTAWTPGPLTGPAARREHAMTWEPTAGVVLLACGRTQQLRRGDTWTFDGSSWTNVTSATVPPRSGAALATPAGPNAAPLLFGGRTGTGLSGELWRWSNGSWLPLATPIAPTARERAALVADGSTGGVFLIGGLDGAGARADVWQFDGAQWTQRSTSGLSARGGSAAIFDASAQRVRLAGGIDGALRRLGDVLELAVAQPTTWTTVRPADTPPARSSHALTYDPGRRRTVLFGGVTITGKELADTWEWDGTSWQPRLGFGPTPRALTAMAWHPGRQTALLFGGRGAGVPLGDTWEWDGSNWNPLAPANAPTPRQEHALTTTRGGGVLLYGGTDALFQVLGDTWRFDGTTWTQLPAFGPGPRRGHALTFDEANDAVVLFGGHDGNGPRNDTWVFEPSGWVLQPTPTAPAARFDAAMTWAAERGRVVLHGGLDGNFQALADSWEWDGLAGIWQSSTAPNTPAPRFLAGMAHHAATDRTILIGGSDGARDHAETERYGAAITATVEHYGTSCPVTPTAVTIAPSPFSRPWLGDTFDIVVSGLPQQSGFGFVVYGFSRTQWLTLTLPAPLGGFGLPGCQLFISADEPFPLLHNGAPVTFSFPIPLLPSFAGFEFFNQVIVFDQAFGNPTGAGVSDALAATVGLR